MQLRNWYKTIQVRSLLFRTDVEEADYKDNVQWGGGGVSCETNNKFQKL